MSETYLIEGFDSNSWKAFDEPFTQLGGAEQKAKALLEQYAQTRVVSQERQGPTVRHAYEREAFYRQSLWDIPVKDVVLRLKRHLLCLMSPEVLDYVSTGMGSSEKMYFSMEQSIPQLKSGRYFIACYAVQGSSEGHFVHIDLVTGMGTFKRICLIKTFSGADDAWRIARIAHDFLAYSK